jgi:peroxiredoxin family protein
MKILSNLIKIQYTSFKCCCMSMEKRDLSREDFFDGVKDVLGTAMYGVSRLMS